MPCAAGYANPPGDDPLGGDTTCALDPRYCAEDHRVSNGACVACDPGVFRASGDPIDGGDTECECKCKARTRAWGFSMSD